MLGQQMKAQQEQAEQVEAEERQKVLHVRASANDRQQPGWEDEAKMKADLKEIVEYAQGCRLLARGTAGSHLQPTRQRAKQGHACMTRVRP